MMELITSENYNWKQKKMLWSDIVDLFEEGRARRIETMCYVVKETLNLVYI